MKEYLNKLNTYIKHFFTYIIVVTVTAFVVRWYTIEITAPKPIDIKSAQRFSPMLTPGQELVIIDRQTGEISVYSSDILTQIYNITNTYRLNSLQTEGK